TRAVALKAQSDADKTLNMILSRLDDMKAEETITIDLRGKSAYSDYMVITSCRANRHVGALAANVAKSLIATCTKELQVEGMRNAVWRRIYSGVVIVEVLSPEARNFHSREGWWTRTRAGERAFCSPASRCESAMAHASICACASSSSLSAGLS